MEVPNRGLLKLFCSDRILRILQLAAVVNPYAPIDRINNLVGRRPCLILVIEWILANNRTLRAPRHIVVDTNGEKEVALP